jgi:rare lipoprotein A
LLKPSQYSGPCAPPRVHRDSDYTPGGHDAPDVADGGPIGPLDVSRLQEPVPRREPRARSGNRSPYTVLGKAYRVMDDSRGYHERGLASWYGTKFNGRATSSGELYDICSFTAAHKTLPLPSYVRVTNLDNGRSLVVRVNDRGPFHEGRVMDLSYAAAVRLGVDRTGTAHVELEAIDPGGPEPGTFARTDAGAAPPRPARPVQDANATTPVAAGELYRAPPPTPRPPADGTVTVVAGSFADAGNARRLADRLGEAGIDAVALDPIDVAGRALWRVRVGPVAADAGDALLQRLRGIGLPDARVLRR